METWKTPVVRLPEQRQKALNQQKRATRITNEHYFRCHPELRVLLSSFISSLLEDKPIDTREYAASYFTDEDLPRKLGFEGWSRPDTPEMGRNGAGPMPPATAEMKTSKPQAATTGETARELERILISLFQEADQDQNGHLDHQEFVRLMETADLGFSEQELHMLVAEVDENSDGRISYAVRCNGRLASSSFVSVAGHSPSPSIAVVAG